MGEALRNIYGQITFKDKGSSEVKKFKQNMNEAKREAISFKEALEAIGVAWGIGEIKNFITESISLAANLDTQKFRLKALADEEYPALKKAIDETVDASKGIATEGELLEAANQALKFGASVGFVKDNLADVQKLSQIVGDNTTEMMQKMTLFVNTGMSRSMRTIPIMNKHLKEFKALQKVTGDEGKRQRQMLVTAIFQKEQLALQKKYNEYLNTTGANLQRIKTWWHEIKEAFGEIMIGPEGWGEVIKLIGLIGTHWGELKKQFSGMSEIAGWIYKYLTWPLEQAIITIKALTIAIEDLMVWQRGGKSITGEIVNSVKRATEGLDKGSGITTSSPPTKKARGGSVQKDKPYWVGEEGPEPFIPDSAGTIIPNETAWQAKGGEVNIQIGPLTFNVSGGREAAQMLESEVHDVINKLSRQDWRAQLGMGIA
jgi:hypothetical protein